MNRRRQLLAAGHPVFAALNRRPLNDEELRQIAAHELLALHTLEQGTAGLGECLDLHNLVAIGVRLARDGIGPELLEVAEPLLRQLQAVLGSPGPVAGVQSLVGALRDLQPALADQRRLLTRAEWLRTMQRVVAGPLRTLSGETRPRS